MHVISNKDIVISNITFSFRCENTKTWKYKTISQNNDNLK